MLSNGNMSAGNVINIVEGTFRKRVQEGTPNAITRVNKKGDTVYELSFTNLMGFIRKIETVETEFGKKVNVLFSDYKGKEVESVVLTLGYADSLMASIMKMLPNVDPNRKVELRLKRSPDDKGKMRTTLFMSQGFSSIKWAYTKDNTQGMPGLEQIKVKGQDVWDNTKQIEFLRENSLKPFIEKIPFEIPKPVSTEEVELGKPSPSGTVEYDDGSVISIEDIPF